MAHKITMEQLKELRTRTMVGYADCKKALEIAEGDIEEAIAIMRKQGIAKAAKKAGRIATQGHIKMALDKAGQVGVLVEVNCETDFTQSNAQFEHYATQVATIALATRETDLDAFMRAPRDVLEGASLEDGRQALVASTGENIQVRRMVIREAPKGGEVAAYTHSHRMGVLVCFDTHVARLGKDIAMHIAATNPQFLQKDAVPKTVLDAERVIFEAQAKESGKPANIVARMVEGRIQKFLAENTLLSQVFVNNPPDKQQRTVEALLQETGVKVTDFVRFELGEPFQKITAEGDAS